MIQPAILTKENLKQKAPTYNLALAIASPTRDLCSAEYIKDLIPPYTSYLVIPSTPTLLLYNTEQILLSVLPQTKNILLDLALPFSNRGNQFQQGYYFGRYLIYDQRLIGVRLSCSAKTQVANQFQTYKKWPMRKTCNYRIPKSILQFYKINKFEANTYAKQVKIGDFLLSFKNVKIHLLFQSQLKNIQNLLNDCKNLGADIISVVNDIPRQKMVESKLRSSNFSCPTTIQNQLKQYARNNKKIVMYTGCKTAPLTQLYLTNPFIIHHQLPQIKMEPHFLNDGGTITVICNIEINRRDIVNSKPTIIKQIPNLVVNSTLREIKTTLPGKSKKLYPKNSNFYGPIPQSMQDILKKMHFWYLYCSINQREPFIIPLPLQPLAQIIIQQLKEISKYTGIPLNTFISFYKTSSDCIVGQEQESIETVIYQSCTDLLSKNIKQKYFFYTDSPRQVVLLSKAAETNSKIFICQKSLLMEQQMEKNRQMQTIEKKIMNFSDKIIDFGIYSLKKIYKENKQSPQPLTKDQLVVAIHENFKTKIRSSLRCHPFYRYVLNLTRQQLQEAFGQVQVQVLQQEKKIHLLIQNQNKKLPNTSLDQQEDTNHNKDAKTKEFFDMLERLKKLYNDNKNQSQPKCHRCQKMLPKCFVKQCLKCKMKTCYLCVQSIRGKSSSLQMFNECIVCKKICYCSLCTQKKKKNLAQKQKILTSSIEIRNLSLSQPQKSLQQLQELKIQRDLQNNACQICQIQGRQIQYMKIVCSQCDNTKCFSCVKSQYKGDRQFVKNWLCNKCKPPQVQKIIEQQPQVQPIQNQDQQDLSPISGSKQTQKRMSKKQTRYDDNQQQYPKQNGKKFANPPANKNQSNRRSPSQSHSPPRNTKQSSNNNANKQSQNIQKKQKGRSPSHSNSPPIKKKTVRSPSHSASPPIHKKAGTTQQSQSKEDNQKVSQKNNGKNNRPHSPSQSRSASRPKKQNKQTLQKKPENQVSKKPRSRSHSPSPRIQAKKKQGARSPSKSHSPQINRAGAKKKSQSRSNSPKKNQKKKDQKRKAHSSSHSPSPVKAKNITQEKSDQRPKAIQKQNKPAQKRKARSPSNSGSNRSARRKKSNSRSRSRSPKKQNKSGQIQEGGLSKPLWGKKANQNQSDYSKNHDGSRESQSRNNSYQQNNYSQGDHHQSRQYNNEGRGGYNQNRQGGWRGRGDRGRDGGRGGYRGRNNDQNRSFQQHQENGSRNYDNRQDNSNRNYNNQNRNSQGQGNNAPEEGQVSGSILNVHQSSNPDIDY